MESQSQSKTFNYNNERKFQDPRKVKLCDLIRATIKEKAWRQKDAAEKAGLHETAISNVCWQDARRYSLRWVLNLCRRLEIPEQRINEAMRLG